MVVLAALAFALLRDDGEDAYAADVGRVCDATYRDLRTLPMDYLRAVIFVSARKRDGLSRLAPPSSRLALHRELLRRESQLAADAQVAIGHMARTGAGTIVPQEFRALRAEEAQLGGLYRRLGIRHCSG